MPSTRVKRTYNLSAETVASVRELAARYVATSQDAVVDLAVERLARDVRDREHAAAWAAAATDPEFTAEQEAIEAEFDAADREAWSE